MRTDGLRFRRCDSGSILGLQRRQTENRLYVVVAKTHGGADYLAHELDFGYGDGDCFLAAIGKFVSSTAPRFYGDFPQRATGHDTVG